MLSAKKILSAVEANPAASNQHELNGVSQFKAIFGTGEFRGTADFIYASGAITDSARVTWYDSRDAHPIRTEHRLYFQSNRVMDAAKAGDTLTITRSPAGTISVEVTPMP